MEKQSRSIDIAKTFFEKYGSCYVGEHGHVCASGHLTKCNEHWIDKDDFILHLSELLDSKFSMIEAIEKL